jgi:pimeloyl-ACP methyl ester carboxylesterase
VIPVSTTVTLESGVNLSYAERGAETGPAVLLLPGPTDSWRSYEPMMRRFPSRIRALAVSQRGHGDSDKPADGYAIEDFAGDAVAMLDALGIDRAVIAGHSGSCLVARRLALDHPERVAGLVLEASPTTLAHDPSAHERVSSVVMNMVDPIDADFARSFITDTSSENIAPDLAEVLVEEVLKVPARVWRAMFSELLAYDDTAELPDLDAPTLLIWGDEDPIVSREMTSDLASRIRNSELTVYSAAGHTPRWDDPPRFSEDLATFVERSAKLS